MIQLILEIDFVESIKDKRNTIKSLKDRISNKFKRAWEGTLITVGGAISDHMITPLMKELFPRFKEFSTWIKEQDWEAIFSYCVY